MTAVGNDPELSPAEPHSGSGSPIVRRPGGRSARVVEQVLQAAGQELARTGYVALSIERVAERAGVNKTTIYRRWPTKRELVASLVQWLGGDPPHAPETGHVASDLLALARATRNRMLEYHGSGLARALLAEADHPEVSELSATLRERFREPWRKVLRAAAVRGELSRDTDSGLVLEVIISAIGHRVVRRHQAPDDSYLESLIKLVLDGARAERSE